MKEKAGLNKMITAHQIIKQLKDKFSSAFNHLKIMEIKLSFFLIFLSIINLIASGQQPQQINNIFQKFQQGYSRRDTSLVNAFVNDLCIKEIQIIGTGEQEWIQGIAAAKQFFRNDWATWLDLTIDSSHVNLFVQDNTAFFTVPGTASSTFPDKEAAYRFALKQLQQTVGKEETARNKLLAYTSNASNFIQQIESGSLDIHYSIRLSGSIVKQNGKWLFSQIVFSFPYPMVRK
jgi:hypothetical protein